MRLIDADSLLEKCHWIIRSDGTRTFACHAEDIESAPTIEEEQTEMSRKTIAKSLLYELPALRLSYTKDKFLSWLLNAYINDELADKPKSAKWIDFGGGLYYCSNCQSINKESKYCPNCGADMRGG